MGILLIIVRTSETMKVLSLSFSLFALASTASVKTPRFSLISERSANGAPTVAVTFPNGHSDTLVLSPFTDGITDSAKNCRYSGHLLSEPEACLAVTGCFGSEDVELSILSKYAPESGMFKWNLDGTVENLKNPFKEKPLVRGGDKEGVDLLVDPNIAAAEAATAQSCASGNCKAVPATHNLQIRVGYGDNFNGKVGSNAAATTYWQNALVHVQAHYCHSSLGSKIKISTLSVNHISGTKITASVASAQAMESSNSARLQGADVMVYMAYDAADSGPSGIASLGVACAATNQNTNKFSISEWQSTAATFAWIAAHEIGHNLGMKHDFDSANGGENGACNKLGGLMSYGTPLATANRWSPCAKKSFIAHYNTIVKSGTWCMEAVSVCTGTTTTTKAPSPTTTAAPSPTTTAAPSPATTAAGCGSPWYVGNGCCDDENNNAACDYDGGDCCGGCTNYCTKCECKNCVDRMPTKRCMNIKKDGQCDNPWFKIECAKTCGQC